MKIFIKFTISLTILLFIIAVCLLCIDYRYSQNGLYGGTVFEICITCNFFNFFSCLFIIGNKYQKNGYKLLFFNLIIFLLLFSYAVTEFD